MLKSILHFGNEQWQVCCCYIKDACVIRELTINISHQFMGAMAGPVENHRLIDDRYSFELVIGNEGPFREAFTELLRHILVSA